MPRNKELLPRALKLIFKISNNLKRLSPTWLNLKKRKGFEQGSHFRGGLCVVVQKWVFRKCLFKLKKFWNFEKLKFRQLLLRVQVIKNKLRGNLYTYFSFFNTLLRSWFCSRSNDEEISDILQDRQDIYILIKTQ